MNKNATDLIKKLIPYFDENLITFNLWEEGNYTPQVTTFFIVKNAYILDKISNIYKELLSNHDNIYIDIKLRGGITMDITLYYNFNNYNYPDNALEQLLELHIAAHKIFKD
jgi:hypothetical protein